MSGPANAPGNTGTASAPATAPVTGAANGPGTEKLDVGDVLQILLPGEDGFNNPFKIDRDGNVILPEVGAIAVAGMTLDAAREKMRAALAVSFRDLSHFNLALKEHRLLLNVLGYVKQPGPVDLPSGANVQMAINAATRFADSQQIRVLRGDGGVENFNLAAYTEGGHVKLPAVQSGDAIFVPEKAQSAEQASWLRTPPGRYEWSDEMSLLDLVAQAGGPTERGDLTGVQILTGDTGGRTTKFDLQNFLDHGGQAGSLPAIHAGYTIVIPELPQTPADERSTWLKQPADSSIYVMGSVGHPGRYAFEQGLSFLDIISAADGPTNGADILNIRVSPRGESRDRVSKVNLAEYFETGDDTLLPQVEPGDVIFVPDRSRNWLEESPANTVRVLGSVGKPGRYEFSDRMSILDLLAEAGGPTREALQSKILVVNLTCCEKKAQLFDLVDFATTGDYSKLPVPRAGDTVYVPSTDQSNLKIFMDGVSNSVSILSILALLKVLL